MTLSYGASAGDVYNQEKNRLQSAGPLAFAYDDEGRLVSSGGACRVFDWNGRLVQIGNDAEFSYDGLGNRILAVRGSVLTRYIYAPWGNLMAEADPGGITRKYIYGKGLIALATASARYCYHFNGIGSATALTDMSKNVVNAYAYDPFGRILLEQEAIQQPFKYVGQYGVMAEPSGLYYMRARYYDPNVGRFISEDPLGFAGGDVNLYAYVQNDPINLVDPDGLIWVQVVGGLVGAGLNAYNNWSAWQRGELSNSQFWLSIGVGAATGVMSTFGGGFLSGLAWGEASSILNELGDMAIKPRPCMKLDNHGVGLALSKVYKSA